MWVIPFKKSDFSLSHSNEFFITFTICFLLFGSDQHLGKGIKSSSSSSSSSSSTNWHCASAASTSLAHIESKEDADLVEAELPELSLELDSSVSLHSLENKLSSEVPEDSLLPLDTIINDVGDSLARETRGYIEEVDVDEEVDLGAVVEVDVVKNVLAEVAKVVTGDEETVIGTEVAVVVEIVVEVEDELHPWSSISKSRGEEGGVTRSLHGSGEEGGEIIWSEDEQGLHFFFLRDEHSWDANIEHGGVFGLAAVEVELQGLGSSSKRLEIIKILFAAK